MSNWNPHVNWRPVMPFSELIKQPEIKDIIEGDSTDDTLRRINRQIERIHPNSGKSVSKSELQLAMDTATEFTNVQQGQSIQTERNFHRGSTATLYPSGFDGKIAIDLSSEKLGKVTSTSRDMQQYLRSSQSEPWLNCHVSRSLELRNQREGIEYRKEHTFSTNDMKVLEAFVDDSSRRFSQAVRHVITEKERGVTRSNDPQMSLSLVTPRGASGARKALWEDQVFKPESQSSRSAVASA